MSDTGFVGMLAHYRYHHGWTWKQLRAVFPGYGSHVWDAVRWRVEDMEAAGVKKK